MFTGLIIGMTTVGTLGRLKSKVAYNASRRVSGGVLSNFRMSSLPLLDIARSVPETFNVEIIFVFSPFTSIKIRVK